MRIKSIMATGLFALVVGSAAGAQSFIREFLGIDPGTPRKGYSIAVTGDLNSDSVPDFVASASEEDTGGVNRGAVYFHSGLDGSELAVINGTVNNMRFGRDVANGGDMNGDGFDDVVIATGSTAITLVADQVFVYSGAWVDWFANGQVGAPPTQILHTLTGAVGEGFGFSVAGGCQLTGDATPDFVVGATRSSVASNLYGACYLYDGSTGTVAATYTPVSFGAPTGMASWQGEFGNSVACVDGYIAIGAPQIDQGASGAGGVFIVQTSGPSFCSTFGAGANSFLGRAVGSAGPNLTGVAEGRLYLFPTGSFSSGVCTSSFIALPDNNYGGFGNLGCAGDLEGDGGEDIMVGNSFETIVRVYDVESNALGSELFCLDPGSTNNFGTDMASEDFDGNGVRELLVGSPGFLANTGKVGAWSPLSRPTQCLGLVSSAGCLPQISMSGSRETQDIVIDVTNMHVGNLAFIVWDYLPTAPPPTNPMGRLRWMLTTEYLCIEPPRFATRPHRVQGTPGGCDGTMSATIGPVRLSAIPYWAPAYAKAIILDPKRFDGIGYIRTRIVEF